MTTLLEERGAEFAGHFENLIDSGSTTIAGPAAVVAPGPANDITQPIDAGAQRAGLLLLDLHLLHTLGAYLPDKTLGNDSFDGIRDEIVGDTYRTNYYYSFIVI